MVRGTTRVFLAGALFLVFALCVLPVEAHKRTTLLPTSQSPIGSYADDGKWRAAQVPNQITVGPDGNLWFTEDSLIGRITLAGDVTEFALPEGVEGTNDIVAGPDGALWFTLWHRSALGRMTVDGVFSEFPMPGDFGPAAGIARGPDGLLWFTSRAGWRVGRLNLDGTLTAFPVVEGNYFGAITAGPDGNLWFLNDWGSRVVRMTPEGIATQFPTPTWGATRLRDIAAGSDGRLWYTDYLDNIVGRVTVSGEFDEYRLKSDPLAGLPVGLTQASDGSMCWAEANRDRIGCLGPSDLIIHLNLPAGSGPAYLTTGPDGNLWITGQTAKRIFVVPPPRRTYLPLLRLGS